MLELYHGERKVKMMSMWIPPNQKKQNEFMKKEMVKKLILKLLSFIKKAKIKPLPKRESAEALSEVVQETDSFIKDSEVKENKDVNFPIFEIGIPNLAKDDNTIKVRKFIN